MSVSNRESQASKGFCLRERIRKYKIESKKQEIIFLLFTVRSFCIFYCTIFFYPLKKGQSVLVKTYSIRKLILIITTVSFGALLYFIIDARYTSIFPHCPFNTITGYYCPGCGSQRAISALLHGDVMQALHFNLLLVLSLPMVGYSAFIHTYNTFAKLQLQQSLFYSPLFVKFVFLVVLLFWIVRNISMYPFSLLAPPQ